jgi:hypothetical protein
MMDSDKISSIQKAAGEIENFRQCYDGCKIYANREGDVDYERMLAWLIENPHMQKIADTISSLKV